MVIAETYLAYDLRSREEIINAIEILRRRLACLIKSKGTLDDPDVLAVSQALDLALNEYYTWVAG